MEDTVKTQIYEDYYMKVRNYILSKINNFHIAEDLCSDVFVKVYEKYDSYDPSKSSLSTWIFTITRNTLIDYYRKNREQVELDENISIEEDDDDSVCNNENLEKLADALKELKPKEKSIIVLHYYEGVSIKDICVKLGISYTYGKILHKKALITLKKYF